MSNVEDAISYYQTFLRPQTRGLPKLSKIEFEFQTTTDFVGSINASLYVFTIGASAQQSTTHDVTYTFQRLPSTGRKHTPTLPPEYQHLMDTIKTTVEAAQAAKRFGNQPHAGLVVKVQYGFVRTLKAGGNIPVEMLTAGINAQTDKNSIQSVTLTFGSD